MLVLSRKVGETIDIAGIKLMVMRISGDKVRLGIEAPSGLRILRGELLEEINPLEELRQEVLLP